MDSASAQLSVALVETSSKPLGVQLVSSKRTNKFSEAADLVELAKSIKTADVCTKAVVGGKLTLIAEQIQYLQNQARKILEDAQRDTALHHAACNMVKKPGTVYFLYRRQSGQSYLSLLSPQEWGASCPHEFLGGYRLEYDHSWTPVAETAKRDKENSFVDNIYQKQQAIVADVLSEENFLLRSIGGAAQIVEMTENRDLLQES